MKSYEKYVKISSSYGTVNNGVQKAKEKTEAYYQFDESKEKQNSEFQNSKNDESQCLTKIQKVDNFLSKQPQNFKDGIMMELMKQYFTKQDVKFEASPEKSISTISHSKSKTQHKKQLNLTPITPSSKIKENSSEIDSIKKCQSGIFPKCHDFLNNFSFEMLANSSNSSLSGF